MNHDTNKREPLSPEQIEKLGQLAKLEIKPELVAPLTNSLNDILTLVEQLSAINTDDVAPLANPCDAEQVLRADRVTETNQRDDFQAIAPQCEAGLYLVPKVIE